MQKCKPWDLTSKADNLAELNEIIYLCSESLRICGILLQPFMPDTMKKLLDMLGVAPGARNYANAMLGSDHDYGDSTVAVGRGTRGVLFPPLISEV